MKRALGAGASLRIAVIAALGWLSGGCAHERQADTATAQPARKNSVRWTVHVVRSLERQDPIPTREALQAAFRLPLEPCCTGDVPFAEGDSRRTPRSCADYLNLVATGFTFDGPNVELAGARNLALRCAGFATLLGAKESPNTAVSGFGFGADALRQLPPLTPVFNDSSKEQRKAALADAVSWREFDPRARIVKRTETTIEIAAADGIAVTVLTLLGWGDFNRDGWEDLLVFADFAVTEGTWRSFELLALTRRKPDAVLQAFEPLADSTSLNDARVSYWPGTAP